MPIGYTCGVCVPKKSHVNTFIETERQAVLKGTLLQAEVESVLTSEAHLDSFQSGDNTVERTRSLSGLLLRNVKTMGTNQSI